MLECKPVANADFLPSQIDSYTTYIKKNYLNSKDGIAHSRHPYNLARESSWWVNYGLILYNFCAVFGAHNKSSYWLLGGI